MQTTAIDVCDDMADFFMANFPRVEWRVVAQGDNAVIGALQRGAGGTTKITSLNVPLQLATDENQKPHYEAWQQWAATVIHQLN